MASKTPISNDFLLPPQLNKKINERRSWANQQRGENADDWYDNQFYKDPKLMNFIDDIAELDHGLYVISGFWGSGKSLTLKILSQELTDFHAEHHLLRSQRILNWKPLEDLTIKEILDQIADGLPKKLKQELKNKIERDLPKGVESCSNDNPFAIATYLTQLSNPEKTLAKYFVR